uniref:Integrase n=1 Tax=Haemonchus contortus TaxID=6289 RepID=A0A7I4YVL8_HAECO
MQEQKGIRARRLTKIRDAVDYVKRSKISYGLDPSGRQAKPGRSPTKWSDFFEKTLNGRNVDPRVPGAIHWTTLARDKDEWRRYWRPLEEIDDQREHG